MSGGNDMTAVRELELLSANRATEQQLARLELAVAAHFGYHDHAPPYHVLLQWLSGKSGADGCDDYRAHTLAETEDER